MLLGVPEALLNIIRARLRLCWAEIAALEESLTAVDVDAMVGAVT